MPKAKSSTPRKKPVAKTAPKKVVSVKPTANDTKSKVKTSVSTPAGEPKKVKVSKETIAKFKDIAIWVVIGLLILFVVDSLVQYLNNSYSIAVVNGSRIPKSEFVHRLEVSYGASIAQNLIDEELIVQKAAQKGYTVSDDEISERYDEIKDRLGGQEALDEALVANNITEDELRNQIKNDLLMEKIIKPGIEYTDEDLQAFFDQYKDIMYADADTITFEDKKDEVEETYITQKINEERLPLLEELREKAVIQDNSTDKPKFGFFKVTRNILVNLYNQITGKE